MNVEEHNEPGREGIRCSVFGVRFSARKLL